MTLSVETEIAMCRGCSECFETWLFETRVFRSAGVLVLAPLDPAHRDRAQRSDRHPRVLIARYTRRQDVHLQDPARSRMTDLSAFAIHRKWPANHPDRLQLYSLPTPNGVKISIALEEIGLPYEVHRVSFDTNDQLTPEFLSLSPNTKFPPILDPNGPGGKPLPLFESGAILIYLADKTGKLMPQDPIQRYQ